jgi:hypothetical protein
MIGHPGSAGADCWSASRDPAGSAPGAAWAFRRRCFAPWRCILTAQRLGGRILGLPNGLAASGRALQSIDRDGVVEDSNDQQLARGNDADVR